MRIKFIVVLMLFALKTVGALNEISKPTSSPLPESTESASPIEEDDEEDEAFDEKEEEEGKEEEDDVSSLEEEDKPLVAPHPKLKGHSFSFLQYSYSESSPTGPSHWSNTSAVKDALKGKQVLSANHCNIHWNSPINIDTKKVVAPEGDTLIESDGDGFTHKSLNIFISRSDIGTMDWQLGHPMDAYTGLEIRAPHWGVFQLNDGFEDMNEDLSKRLGLDQYTNYDFRFASLFYCDPNQASSKRSMHQINGKKFPLEIDFTFFNQPINIGVDKYLCDDHDEDPEAPGNSCTTVAVMLVVLAEFSKEDNPRLAPLLRAVQKYEGPSFDADDEDEGYTVEIDKPWSPTWLIPVSSAYYYYDHGSFPVPPCWSVLRVYVAKEYITISERQLAILANVKTAREQGGRMPCTFSLLQNNAENGDYYSSLVKYNEWKYAMKGKDGRELTKGEREELHLKSGATTYFHPYLILITVFLCNMD